MYSIKKYFFCVFSFVLTFPKCLYFTVLKYFVFRTVNNIYWQLKHSNIHTILVSLQIKDKKKKVKMH